MELENAFSSSAINHADFTGFRETRYACTLTLGATFTSAFSGIVDNPSVEIEVQVDSLLLSAMTKSHGGCAADD